MFEMEEEQAPKAAPNSTSTPTSTTFTDIQNTTTAYFTTANPSLSIPTQTETKDNACQN
eukprot:Pgem_evm1s13644